MSRACLSAHRKWPECGEWCSAGAVTQQPVHLISGDAEPTLPGPTACPAPGWRRLLSASLERPSLGPFPGRGSLPLGLHPTPPPPGWASAQPRRPSGQPSPPPFAPDGSSSCGGGFSPPPGAGGLAGGPLSHGLLISMLAPSSEDTACQWVPKLGARPKRCANTFAEQMNE